MLSAYKIARCVVRICWFVCVRVASGRGCRLELALWLWYRKSYNTDGGGTPEDRVDILMKKKSIDNPIFRARKSDIGTMILLNQQSYPYQSYEDLGALSLDKPYVRRTICIF